MGSLRYCHNGLYYFLATCLNVGPMIVFPSAAEEACIRVPGEVCRGAAGPGAAVHQHLPAGP